MFWPRRELQVFFYQQKRFTLFKLNTKKNPKNVDRKDKQYIITGTNNKECKTRAMKTTPKNNMKQSVNSKKHKREKAVKAANLT